MGLMRGQSDPAFVTHEAYYEHVKKHCDAVLIENVVGYQPSIIRSKLGNEFEVRSTTLDPRCFGIPAARTRLYAICWRKAKVIWRSDVDMNSILDILSSQVGGTYNIFWWKNLPPSSLTPAQVL